MKLFFILFVVGIIFVFFCFCALFVDSDFRSTIEYVDNLLDDEKINQKNQ